ncbi:kelch-like protein [Brazilian porcupinepox virus 1]|nr:kelch-like protein [Brazilian porcupinepox virus 1]
MLKNSFKNIRYFFKSSILCDVNIKLKDGNNIKAHKLILSAFSPYFNNLINKYIKDDEIDLTYLDSDAVRLIIDFIYDDNKNFIDINFNNIFNVLLAADFLQIDDIVSQCKIYMVNSLYNDNTNIVLIYNIISTVLYNDKTMLKSLNEYIENRFIDIYKNKWFLKYPLYLFSKFLQVDKYIFYSYNDIAKNIIEWINYNKERMSYIKDLINYIDTDIIDKDKLDSLCKLNMDNELFNNIDNSYKKIRLFDNIFYFSQNYYDYSSLFRSSKIGINKLYVPFQEEYFYGSIISINNKIYIIGCYKNNSDTLIIEYNLANSEYNIINVFPEKIKSPGLAILGNYLYIISAYNGITLIKVMDINTYKVFDKEPINKELYNIFTTIVEDTLYIIGNNNKHYMKIYKYNEDNVYMFKLVNDNWVKCKSPTNIRINGSFNSVGKNIYYMGGIDINNKPTDIIEYYDTENDTWECSIYRLPTNLPSCGSFVINDTIYIMNGIVKMLDFDIVLYTLITYNTKTGNIKYRLCNKYREDISDILFINNNTFTILK